jgi:hypothetical protein
MRARGALAALAALALIALLVGWFAPRAGVVDTPVTPGPARTAPSRAVTPSTENLLEDPLDPATLERAILGEFGVELRNRICALCGDGRLVDPACRPCGDGAPVGRVYIDVVDEEGRPFSMGEVYDVRTCVGTAGLGGSGFNLRPGPCGVRATRVDGAYEVLGPELRIDVVAGQEDQILLEMPSTPWGGVGVTLRGGPDGGVIVGRAIEGHGANGAGVPDGATLLAVGDVPTDGLEPHEVSELLTGPAGSKVEVHWTNGEGEPRTSVIERRPLPASALRLGENQAG